MRSSELCAALAAVLTLSQALPALSAPVTTMVASGAWSRPVVAGLATGVAYLTVRNTGATADRLVGASTPVAARASLHRSMDMGGTMSMTPVAGGLPLPPDGAVRLAPGGYHIMLEGLKRGLKAGARYPLTLSFAHARPLVVEVAVAEAAPPSP